MGWGHTGSEGVEPSRTRKDKQFRVATNIVYRLDDETLEIKFDDPENNHYKSLETEGLP